MKNIIADCTDIFVIYLDIKSGSNYNVFVKKIIIIIFCIIAAYTAVCFVGLAFASSEIKQFNLFTDARQIESIFLKIDRIQRDIFLVKPFLMLNSQWKDKILTLEQIKKSKPIISALLNTDEEKTYLVVMQNNAELRPSGGVWGSYGILKIKKGKITSFKTDDTYSIDQNFIGRFSPPEEVKDIIQDQWRFWNSNWSADFAVSAREGLSFFEKAHPETKFDGVIGPNVDLVLELLKISGPVSLEGQAVELNSGNFVQKMIYDQISATAFEMERASSGVVKPSEKNFLLSDIGLKIINQIILHKQFTQLFVATYDGLENNDLQLYFCDAKVQNEVEKLDWGGRVDTSRNFLQVVDANLGSKLDFLIDKKVQIEKSGSEYKITLIYKNNFKPDEGANQPAASYRSFVRLFVPTGSKLVSQTGGEKLFGIKKDGLTDADYIATMLAIKPGEQQILVFQYQPNNNVAQSPLTVYKQSGSHAQITETR